MLGDYLANVRRNDALEHATVSMLLARFGPHLRIVGRASADGFFLYGDVPAAPLAECAKESLARLQRGEAFWATTPLCGTNIVTTAVLAALSSLAVSRKGAVKDNIGSAILASMLAVTVAQPLGRLIQRHVTTSPDLGDTEIVAIESRSDGRYHRVRTRRLAA
jgi:hypothetical protein